MFSGLVSPAEAARLITAGRYYIVAADAQRLRELPAGNWIGGSITYFVAGEGGQCSRDKVFMHEVPANGAKPAIRFYEPQELSKIFLDGPENGFSLIIIPAFSQAHADFASQAPDYPEAFMKPLAGWIAGVHLDDLGKAAPCVANGRTSQVSESAAVVMHVPLPAGKAARIEIVNLFRPGAGASITFAATGFSAGDCLIDGQPGNLADHIAATGADTRLPLVADYCGAMINVSIRSVDAEKRRVEFYAPVFAGMEYRLAAPMGDYIHEFSAALPASENAETITFSCNCILNYLYSELEGRRTGPFTGPATFGEVAYQLLNQTLVYVSIDG
jgi:hypothetical protein